MFLSHLSPLSRWAIVGILAIVVLSLPHWILSLRYADKIFLPDDAPTKSTAIVFGAGLSRSGDPSTVLADRVLTAAALYQQGKVSKILLSGSSHSSGYNEPLAMKSLAMDVGVPTEDILIDTGGFRTFDTCLRAKQVFGIENALLISQRFHLPRALILCNGIDLSADGVAADLHTYRARFFWEIREIPATLRALWDIYTSQPEEINLSQKNTNQPMDGTNGS
jgi:SanA protein